MIPFFVGYALVVWYVACRWRRRWEGFAAVAAAVAVLAGLAWCHWQFADYVRTLGPGQGVFREVFQALFYPYTALVGGVGIFLAVLPLAHPPEHCPVCGYDLAGLGRPVRTCPECGADPLGAKDQRLYRASGSDRVDLEASDVRWPSPAKDAVGNAGAKHQQG